MYIHTLIYTYTYNSAPVSNHLITPSKGNDCDKGVITTIIMMTIIQIISYMHKGTHILLDDMRVV
jgi:hypothetical protein